MENNTNKSSSFVMAIIGLAMAPIVAVVGLIIGIIGLCHYEKKSTGWIISLVATSVAATNMVIGLILALCQAGGVL